METIYLVLAFIFGTLIGSFLNVIALRLNSGVSFARGRSRCMSCGRELSWKELMPIASYIWQKGKCRQCHSRISIQYPLVEFLTAVLFVLLFLYFPVTNAATVIHLLIYAVTTSILIVICAYDIRHKIIPDACVYTFDGLALISLFIGGSASISMIHGASLSAILAGPILAAPFALIWLFSGGTLMGLGDAKLVLGIGWLLGIDAGVNAIVLSFWVAAAVSLIWLFYKYRRFKPRTEIPFGPYLILGMYLALFTNLRVIDVHTLVALIRQL
ncbi:MAG: prepilin peptidase [Patescibacteria group bacterium]|nr:prepilin peptidase [Patescibacteria group bacterium]MDE2172385.1 prepilin peptidase [Patescibacteria group bacterium]